MDRLLGAGIFAPDDVAALFSDRAFVDAMLQVEGALAEAAAERGRIPREAAAAIVACCAPGALDEARIAESLAGSGTPVIALARLLGEAVAARDKAAARHVHLGATSQDVVDTALVLLLRRVHAWIDGELARSAASCAHLAETHRATPMLGRTLLQPGPPIPFGLKAAGWLASLMRAHERLARARKDALVLQFGGAVGTLASLGDDGPAIAAAMARRLELDVPAAPWHAQRDAIAALGCEVAILTGSLTKIAGDVALGMQFELGELAEPMAPGRGGSSAMPHKRNPVGAMIARAALPRVAGHAATLIAAMDHEAERALGGWQAEWATVPDLHMAAAGALRATRECLEGLHVDAEAMARNIARTGGVVMSERVAAALAAHMPRTEASEHVERAVRTALAEGRPLAEMLQRDARVAACLDAGTLARLLDPADQFGAAPVFIDRVLAGWRASALAPLAEAEAAMPFALNQQIRIHYRVEGPDDAPALLLLNSIGCDHAMWSPVMPQLLKRLRVIRMDTRGHGASDAPPGDYDLGLLAADARAVLDAAGIARASICGLSLGGMIAMRLALEAPARVDRLILACTSPAMPRDVWIERIRVVRSEGMAAITDAALGRFFTPSFRAREAGFVAGIRRTLLSTDPQGYAACGAAIRDMELLGRLGAIAAPTLVIAGSEDVSTPVAGHGDRLVAGIPGARLVVLPTAHIACAEAPDAFAAAVLGFLGDTPAKSVVDEARATLFADGIVNRRAVLGDAWVDASLARRNAFNADFQDLITRNAWSEIWSRPGLDHRTRRLLVLAMTAAMGRWDEFRLHVRAGLAQQGFTRDELKEAILQTAVYCGVPAGNTAMHHAEAIIAELDAAPGG